MAGVKRQYSIDFTKWELTLKLSGWWPATASFLLLAALYILILFSNRSATPAAAAYSLRAIETIAPLAFSIQAVLLLGPDNEAALELLLTLPLPVSRLFLQRLSITGFFHLCIALTATLLFALSFHTENFFLACLRWFPTAVFLGGLAIYATQLTRQGILGMLVATLFWAASLTGGDGLLTRWEWMWPFHPYLQPERFGMDVYLLNRLIILLLGLFLGSLGMLLLRNEDRVLGNR